ncbi:hypothetical protein Tco_1103854 [Tanacetum coccineum]
MEKLVEKLDNVKEKAMHSAAFRGVEGAVKLRRWFKKTESVFEISECAKEGYKYGGELWNLKVKEYDIVAYTQRFNKLALMCSRMVEPGRVKIDAYIRGLTNNIKGEVKSSKPADLNEAVRMAYKMMEQKSVRLSSTSVERLDIRKGTCPEEVKKEKVGKFRGHAYANYGPVRKHDVHYRYGGEVVVIPYGNKTLIVKVQSRLKIILCIKAHVPVIRDFPKVFPEELPGLPPPRQVEF